MKAERLLTLHQDPRVEAKFQDYPPKAQAKLMALRKLILDTAEVTEEVTTLEETLKWGQLSYVAKKGSTFRIDWSPKSPDQYAMYFQCTSKLVPTFKTLFGDTFRYEKTRALLFDMDQDLPIAELKSCIEMALTYHRIKNQPLLGR